MRDPKMDLKLAIFSSRFRIAVLGHPPLLEKAPGIVAVVRVEGVRRRSRSRRYNVRGLASPGKRTKAVVHDEPRNKVEKFIAMNRGFTDRRHEQKSLISPHASETLAHWHIPLRDLLLRSLAAVVFASHGFDWIYKKGKELLQGYGRRRSAKEQLLMEVYSRPKPSAGI